LVIFPAIICSSQTIRQNQPASTVATGLVKGQGEMGPEMTKFPMPKSPRKPQPFISTLSWGGAHCAWLLPPGVGVRKSARRPDSFWRGALQEVWGEDSLF